MKEDGENLLACLAARQRGTKNEKISFKIFKKVLLGRQFKQVNFRKIRTIHQYQNLQVPKPFESTSGRPIEAAGRLLIVNQEVALASRC